jgi:hypothetical protein
MICHPTVTHINIANDSHDDSSTGTVNHMVDYAQVIHLNHYNVSLGTNYNRTLLKEINANCDGAPSDSPAPLPALAHVAYSFSTAPAASDEGCFYDDMDTKQVKAMPTDISIGDPTQLYAALVSRIHLSMALPVMVPELTHDDSIQPTLRALADSLRNLIWFHYATLQEH